MMPGRSSDLRPRFAAAGLVALLGLGGTGTVMAQVPVPLPVVPHRLPPPACRSTVRYFGVGSVTVDYRLERTSGPFHYRVPPHALPLIVGHTGSMRGTTFFESQRWQNGRLLGRMACRSLTRQQPVSRLTITDRHGRRVGMITATLIAAGPGMTP